MSKTIDAILTRGGRAPEASKAEYRSMIDSAGRPQMGFTILRKNGDMDGFLYHSLDNLQLRGRFLSFTHRSKAVTIEGDELDLIFRAIMRHTLVEIAEPDGRPAVAGLPVIVRMEITTAGEVLPGQGPKLVKPA